MFTKHISKDSHHFSWIVLSCFLFYCCVPESPLRVTPVEIPSYFYITFETENTWQMLQDSILLPCTNKNTFLVADEIQNIEGLVGQCACQILALFSENKRITTKDMSSFTAEKKTRAWREQSSMSHISRSQIKRKTENRLKFPFI